MHDPGARELPEVPPHKMAGFREARAAGLLPVVPALPPALLPGPSARQVFHRFLLRGAAAVGAVLVLLRVLPGLGLPAAWNLLAVAAGLLVWWLVLRWWRQIGDRNAEELQHGYTTFVMQFGGFQRGERRRWKGAHSRAPWDYSGVWVLDGDGRVVSAPRQDRDPPGFYPSPSRPEAWELWSGVVWTGEYRPAPVPRS